MMITRFNGVSGITNKDNAYDMCVILEKDKIERMEALEEEYKKLINKYHSYWLSKEGGLVPEQTCGFCGEHSWKDHPKDSDMSVTSFGSKCYKKPVTLSILERVGYNTHDNWYGADKDKIVSDVKSDHTYSKSSAKYYRRLDYHYTPEEISIIFDNLVKYGRICFCKENRPTLTLLGEQVLVHRWCGERSELPEENLLRIWGEAIHD